jgi:Tol biopolymer transport system component
VRASRPTIAIALTSLLLLAVLAAGGGPASGAAFPGADGRIAYASNQSGNWDIYTMNADGSGQRRLTTDPADDTQPSFSADGAKIAFASDRSGNYDIYTMNADGSGVVRLTTDPGVDTQPAFSPSGAQIAFIGKHGASWYGDVYLMNADGTNQVRLIGQGGIEDGPTFSPDGQRIAFGRTEGGHKHIFTMSPAGGELTALTHGAFDDRQPSFSPDGQRIAFSSRREGRSQIFVMRSDGSGVTRLTGRLSSTMPAYSPDGRQIAFVRGGHVFTMNAGGGGETQLTSGRGSQAWPSWQPLVGSAGGRPPGGSPGHGASNRLRIGKPILNRRRGTAKLPVTVPAAGTLSLRGHGIRSPGRRSVARAGTVKLLVKPSAATARALARKGRAKVKALVAYARKGGGRETATKAFELHESRRR